MASGPPLAPKRAVAIASVAVLAVVVGVLAVMAYLHANPRLPAESAAPVPTFALGVETATPTPTPLAAPTFSRASERFLATAAGTLWRAVAGACGSTKPVIERSNDGGRSWTRVTPDYLGIAQVASLDGIAVDAAEAVAGVSGSCATQALRSFTNGEFWASYPDVLTISRYVTLADPSKVHLETGVVAAPCPVAHGLRAWRDRVALVCDGTAYALLGGHWTALPGTDAAAVAIADTDVVSAHVAAGCKGFTLTRFARGAPDAGTVVGCAPVKELDAPLAIVAYNGGYLVWSGNQLVTVR